MKIKTLLLDIGGVILTNGWDHISRQKAVEYFELDKGEFDERHQLAFDTYELGRLTFDEYLNNLLFYKKRSFSKGDFKDFIFSQSLSLPGALDYFKRIKEKYQLRIIALNNEPKDINEYRIKTFDLNSLFDGYVSSCYVGMRKPDPGIYHLARHVSGTDAAEALYIDDRELYIEVGKSLGLHCLHYEDLDHAKENMKEFEII